MQKRIRRETLLRYCTACNKKTEQTRLTIERVWRCRTCGAELIDSKHAPQTGCELKDAT